MTVPSIYAPVARYGNGGSVNFPFPYQFFDGSDLFITLIDAAMNPIVPPPALNGGMPYDYTVTGTVDPETGEYLDGTVVFNTPPPAGWRVTIRRDIPEIQPAALADDAPFPAKSVEAALDRCMLNIQELKAAIAELQQGGGGGGQGLISVANIAELRALPAIPIADGTVTVVRGYYAPGDGGGGSFYYDAAEVGADNGGTIIVDAEDRRWRRVVPSSGITPKMFGARGNGVADDADRLLVYQAYVEGGVWTNDLNCVYRTSKALSPKVKEYYGNGSTLAFNIPNHTDNCFAPRPIAGTNVNQDESRFTYWDLRLVANMTGLDLLYIEDGSPIFFNLFLDASYRDAMQLHPHQANNQAIENLTVYNWLVRDSGRHALHAYLDGNGAAGPAVYINESNFYGWEIRGMGSRFAGANAVRVTHSNITADYNKFGNFKVHGGNWDCGQPFSLGGNSVGPAIYADVINGSTVWIMESIELDVGGIESTPDGGGTALQFVMDSSDPNYTIGQYRQCEIRAITYYAWVFGVPPVWREAKYGNRYYGPNEFPLPAQNLLAIMGDPADNIAIRPLNKIVSGPSGDLLVHPYISSDFQNGPCVHLQEIALVASTTVTADIPVRDVRQGDLQGYQQWPIKVMIDHSSFPDDESDDFGQYGEYLVRCGWKKGTPGTPGPHAVMEIISAINGPVVAEGFDPANGVSFTMESADGGTTFDILRVHIACGALVGGAGGNVIAQVAASRFGLPVLNESNRQGPPVVQVNQRL